MSLCLSRVADRFGTPDLLLALKCPNEVHSPPRKTKPIIGEIIDTRENVRRRWARTAYDVLQFSYAINLLYHVEKRLTFSVCYNQSILSNLIFSEQKIVGTENFQPEDFDPKNSIPEFLRPS